MGWIAAWAAICIGLVKTTRWWDTLLDHPEWPNDDPTPCGRWGSDGLRVSVSESRRDSHPCPCEHHAGDCPDHCVCRRKGAGWTL